MSKNCTNNCFGYELIGLSSSLSIAISKEFNSEDLGILGAFFSTLGDNLALLSATKAIPEANETNNCTSNNEKN